MKVTKLGHCSLLIENKDTKVLVDPGIFSHFDNILPNYIIITHEHSDHLDIEKVTILLSSHSDIVVYTTDAVKQILKPKIGNTVISISTDKKYVLGSIPFDFEINIHWYITSLAPQPQVLSFIVDNNFLFTSDAVPKYGMSLSYIAFPIVAPFLDMQDVEETYFAKFNGSFVLAIHDGFLTKPNPFLAITAKLAEKYNKILLEDTFKL